MVGGNRVSDVLQHHGLARLRRGHEQTALALADRRNHVDDAARHVLFTANVALEQERLVRVQRREVLEHDLMFRGLGWMVVDLVDLHQREVALAVLRRTHFPFDRVAGMQVEAADLRRADIDIVRAGQIRRLGRAQETEAIRQHLERTVAVDGFAGLCALLQNGEHQLLLAKAVCVLDIETVRHFKQFGDVLGL